MIDEYMKSVEDAYRSNISGSPDDVYDSLDRVRGTISKLSAMAEEEKLSILHAVHTLYRIRSMMLESRDDGEFAHLDYLGSECLNTLMVKMALLDDA